MKKRYIYLLLFLLMIPCFIKADYLGSSKDADKYKNRIISSAISNYFYNDDYALEGNTVKKVNDNFLSIDEFNITSISNGVYKNGYSYIYDGSKVWTLTVNDENSHFVMSNFKNDTSNNSSNNVYTKPTIMINPSKVASGSGRFEDPWVFIEEYDVIFTSEDEDIIKINPKKIKVLSGESGTVGYEVLKNGYSIKGTSCKDAASIDNTNKKITVKNVTRNMECIVYIDTGLYEITLEGYASPKVLYLKFDKGYYKDKQATEIASKIEVPTKTGHTFGGYRYGDTLFIDASGKIVGAKNLITGDVTLSPIMNAVKTTYNYTCSSDVTICTYDIDCRIAGSICGKKGYTHTGWVDQNGKTYVTEENVKNYVSTKDVTLTLTPTYTAKSYTLYYDGNGGSVSSTNKSVTFDSAYGELPTPTRTGYTFSGWYTAVSGGTKVTASSIYTTDNSSTIYAHWSANNYTIVYNKNNGSGTMSNTTCTYGSNCTLSSNAYSRTGYTFLGWSTSSSATSATYTNGQTVSNLTTTNNGTVNLYAVWKANTYTIVYNKNNGSGTMSNTSCLYGSSYSLRNNTFTRTGYSFLGWSTSSSATSATYTNGQSVSNLTTTNGGTVTLYAVWLDNIAPTCSISKSTSSTVSSLKLTINASDSGSGVYRYSWNNSSYSSTNYKTISSNGTYTAYVKDYAGNIGSCSLYVSNIQTCSTTVTSSYCSYYGWVQEYTECNGWQDTSGECDSSEPSDGGDEDNYHDCGSCSDGYIGCYYYYGGEEHYYRKAFKCTQSCSTNVIDSYCSYYGWVQEYTECDGWQDTWGECDSSEPSDGGDEDNYHDCGSCSNGYIGCYYYVGGEEHYYSRAKKCSSSGGGGGGYSYSCSASNYTYCDTSYPYKNTNTAIYTSPGKNGGYLCTIPAGTTVYIIDDSSNWVYVRSSTDFSGTNRYVSSPEYYGYIYKGCLYGYGGSCSG